MTRYGQVIKLKKDKVEYYKELHRAVWPEVLERISACNISNYSIYFYDEWLFAYFEYIGENFPEDMEKMAEDGKTQEWWALCKPCQKPVETAMTEDWWVTMEEVFHYD